jgi:hypothetical protein
MAVATSHGNLGSLQSCYLSKCSPSQKGGATIFMTKFERATGLVYKQRFGTICVLSSTSPVIDPVQLPSSGIPDGPRKKLSNQFFFYYKIFLVFLVYVGS